MKVIQILTIIDFLWGATEFLSCQQQKNNHFIFLVKNAAKASH